MHVLLSILFSVVLQHGCNVKDLVLPSIITIPKDRNFTFFSSTK